MTQMGTPYATLDDGRLYSLCVGCGASRLESGSSWDRAQRDEYERLVDEFAQTDAGSTGAGPDELRDMCYELESRWREQQLRPQLVAEHGRMPLTAGGTSIDRSQISEPRNSS